MKLRNWLLFPLMAVALTVLSGAQSPITGGWPQLVLYRANLHAHTRYSDFQGSSVWMHGRNPWLAAEQARGNGLDALAVTDHGERLGNYPARQVEVVLEKGRGGGVMLLTGAGEVEKDRLRGCLVGLGQMGHYAMLQGNTATATGETRAQVSFWSGHLARDKFPTQPAAPIRATLVGGWEDSGNKAEWFQQDSQHGVAFELLRGFEWGSEATGHANVIGTDDYCGVNQGKLGCLEDRGATRSSVADFYGWIGERQEDRFVCQFNHPTLYVDRKKGVYPFDQFACPTPNMLEVVQGKARWDQVAAPVRRFALMEMYTHGLPVADIRGVGDGRSPEKSNEYWFRKALGEGWRVAPSNGEDNHYGANAAYGATRFSTGVWVSVAGGRDHAAAREAFLDALLERRTFSSEDKDFDLQFWADQGSQAVPMGGVVEVAKGAPLTLHLRATDRGGHEVGTVQLVAVREGGAVEELCFPEGLPEVQGRQDWVTSSSYDGKLTLTPPEDLICYYVKIRDSQGGHSGLAPGPRQHLLSAPIWVAHGVAHGTTGPRSRPTATVFLMDCSSSMNSNTPDGVRKLEAAKQAARHYLDLIRFDAEDLGAEHQVGVVSFSREAEPTLPLTSDLTQAQRAVAGLSPIANTNFGDPLDLGLSWLENSGTSGGPGRSIILFLSDGMTNAGPISRDEFLVDTPDDFAHPLRLYQRVRDGNIAIHTIGFGDPSQNSNDAGCDEEVLRKIAETPGTGGGYLSARDAFELDEVYVRSFHDATGSVVFESTGVVANGERKVAGSFDPRAVASRPQAHAGTGWQDRLSFLITPAYAEEATGSQMLVTLGWSSGRLGLELKDPNGKVVDEAYPGAHWKRDEQPVCLAIDTPQLGQWTATVIGEEVPAGESRYHLIASARVPGAPAGGAGSTAPDWQTAALTGAVVGLLLLTVLCLGVVMRRRATGSRPVGAPMAWVRVRPTIGGAREVPITGAVTRIGRGPGNQIMLADPKVSGQHLELRFQGGELLAVDLGSTNGTWVQGERIAQASLRPGDVVRVGDTALTLQPPRTQGPG